MPNLTPSDLRDPQPPLPGARERALVSERAQQLGRRRHLAQGGGALALVAVVAVSVAALTLYDMCKAVDKTMQIDGIRVTEKIKQ